MMNKFLINKFLALALLGTSFLTTAAYAQKQIAPPASAQVVAQEGAEDQKRIATEPFVRTELFFGADKPDGTEVSEEDFQYFLDKKVTPLFPDRLTVLSGKGQFCCDAGAQLVQERSFVLVLLYPRETKESSSKKIEQIRKEYKTDFQQQSVLRVDDPRPVRVSC
ncbi:DUF3574 domain-containing protein [soil metagenome]